MADVVIHINVSKDGAVVADTGGDAGPDEDLVLKVKLGPRPCPVCRSNANDVNPRMPPLHGQCHCTAYWARKDSVLDALR